eukprot:170242-Chlamydomonas_euryale.AAC.21
MSTTVPDAHGGATNRRAGLRGAIRPAGRVAGESAAASVPRRAPNSEHAQGAQHSRCARHTKRTLRPPNAAYACAP